MKMRLIIVLVISLALGLLTSCGGGGGGGGNTLGPDDVIIMYGNSITHRGPWAALFPNNTILNYGVDGDRTAGMLARLPNALAQNPKVICVMGGINDIIAHVSVSSIFSNLQQILLRSKAAGVTVVMQSTLHTGADYPNSRYINETVVQLNAMLSSMATSQGQIWLDLNSSLSKDGYMEKKYLLSDNLHPNDLGYQVWAGRLNDALP